MVKISKKDIRVAIVNANNNRLTDKDKAIINTILGERLYDMSQKSEKTLEVEPLTDEIVKKKVSSYASTLKSLNDLGVI